MLADKLDRLLAAFKARGRHPDLRPGATEVELDQIEEALELPLPDELRALWAWRNGHTQQIPQSYDTGFVFRDKFFTGTPEVPKIRKMVLLEASEPEEWRKRTFDPVICIPFAIGGGFTVVSCGPQGDAPHLPNSVLELQGEIVTAYESIEKMIDTNIEIREVVGRIGSKADREKAWEIRRKHNPLIPIFQGRS